jgi:hypothetical protein
MESEQDFFSRYPICKAGNPAIFADLGYLMNHPDFIQVVNDWEKALAECCVYLCGVNSADCLLANPTDSSEQELLFCLGDKMIK